MGSEANRKQGEEPLKRDDHAMDCLRYLCMELDGPQPDWNIRQLRLCPEPLPVTSPDVTLPFIRYFAGCDGYQPLPEYLGQKYYGPSFKTTAAAALFVVRFHERMGMPSPYPAPEGVDAEGVAQIEKALEKFLSEHRLIPAN